jgi:hypothetical protein
MCLQAAAPRTSAQLEAQHEHQDRLVPGSAVLQQPEVDLRDVGRRGHGGAQAPGRHYNRMMATATGAIGEKAYYGTPLIAGTLASLSFLYYPWGGRSGRALSRRLRASTRRGAEVPTS